MKKDNFKKYKSEYCTKVIRNGKDFQLIRLTNFASMLDYGYQGMMHDIERDYKSPGHFKGFRELLIKKDTKTGKYLLLNKDRKPVIPDLWVDNIALVSWFGGSGLTWGEDATFGILLLKDYKFAALYPNIEECMVKRIEQLTNLGEFTYEKYYKYHISYDYHLVGDQKIYQQFANYNEDWVERPELTEFANGKYAYYFQIDRSCDYTWMMKKMKEPYIPFRILKKGYFDKWTEYDLANSEKELNEKITNIINKEGAKKI